MNSLFLIAYPSSLVLAQQISSVLAIPIIIPELICFADGEYEVRLPDATWERSTVIVIQPERYPTHDAMLQYILTIHALRKAAVTTIIALFTYLWYSQQHRFSRATSQDGIQSIVSMFESCGVDQFIVLELHDLSIVSYFKKPVYHVQCTELIIAHIQRQIPEYQRAIVVSPDAGGAWRARQIANYLKIPYLILQKKRTGRDRIAITAIEDVIPETTAIMVDDIIKTGSTALQACAVLRDVGVSMIYGYFIHGLRTQGTCRRFAGNTIFEHIWIGNTHDVSEQYSTVGYFDVSPSLVSAIRAVLSIDHKKDEVPLDNSKQLTTSNQKDHDVSIY